MPSLPQPSGSIERARATGDDSWGIELWIPTESEYFLFGELDRVPEPQEDIGVPLATPSDLSGSGRTILVLFVAANGHVDKVEVESSELSLAHLERAIDSFRNATFLPAEKDGQPVNSRVRIEISYD